MARMFISFIKASSDGFRNVIYRSIENPLKFKSDPSSKPLQTAAEYATWFVTLTNAGAPDPEVIPPETALMGSVIESALVTLKNTAIPGMRNSVKFSMVYEERDGESVFDTSMHLVITTNGVKSRLIHPIVVIEDEVE